MNIIEENRVGRLDIDYELVRTMPNDILEVLKDILIVRAEHDFLTMKISYYGYSKHFEKNPTGTIIPKYKSHISIVTDKTFNKRYLKYTFEKLNEE